MTIPLKFNIDRVVLAERTLGMKLADIVAEAQSETGMSLTTLRTLLAVGSINRMLSMVPPSHGILEEQAANALITKHGLSACGAAVGVALSGFLAGINREAA